MATGDPVVTFDTKKELIGPFKNPGQAWWREPEALPVHGFPQEEFGHVIPFGIYEVNHNHGFVRIGDCSDTLGFAVESTVEWWWSEGQRRFLQTRPVCPQWNFTIAPSKRHPLFTYGGK